ncbi:MAG: phage tail tube protein [Pseudomonadota bacterium]
MTLIAANRASLSLIDNAAPLLLAALRRYELSISRTSTDITQAAGSGWRDAAVLDRPLTADLRASGVFVTGAGMAAVREHLLAATAPEFAFTLPGEGTWQGAFYITSLSLNGQTEDELSFSLRLTSTGTLTFTPSVEE